MDQAELTIAQMASQSGLSAYTLRYYERAGLIGLLGRNASGHRRYRTDDIAWVAFLNRLRETGMPIRQMKQYADLRAQGPRTAKARRELLEQHQHGIRARMALLTANLSVLDDKIKTYREMEAGVAGTNENKDSGK